jgi:hypothetical protein
VAVHGGTVAFAGTFSGFGNLVILDHGSQTFSLYGDLLEIAVTKGARVDRGQPLGSVGPTRPQESQDCISSFASTVSRWTRYNGLGGLGEIADCRLLIADC